MASDTIVSVNDLSQIQHNIMNKKVCVIGNRDTGKSRIIREMIETVKQDVKFDLNIIVSVAEEAKPEYSKQFNDAYVYFNYIDELIDSLPNLCNMNENVLVVFEDLQVINKDKIKQSKIMNLLTIKNLTLLASTQCVIDKSMIDKFNYLLFAQDNSSNGLMQKYCAMNHSFIVGSLNGFESSMKKLSNYQFLCIENVKNCLIRFNMLSRIDHIINATIIGDDCYRNLNLIKSLICVMNSDKDTKIDNVVVITNLSNQHVYSELTKSVYPGISVVKKIIEEQQFNKEHYLIIFDVPYDKDIYGKQLVPELMFDTKNKISCIKIVDDQCDLTQKSGFNTDLFLINTNRPVKITNLSNTIACTINRFNTICSKICNDEQCVVVSNTNEKYIQWFEIEINDMEHFKQYSKIHFDYVDNIRNVYDLNHDNMHDDNEIPIIYDEHTLSSIKKLRTKTEQMTDQLDIVESLISINGFSGSRSTKGYSHSKESTIPGNLRSNDQILKQIKNHSNKIRSLIDSMI
jgi:hypothetical protein